MDHDIDPAQGQGKSGAVADVAQEETHARHLLGVEPLAQLLLHFALLQLVTRIDDDLAKGVAGQHGLDETAAERTGAAGDQDHLAVEVEVPGRETAHADSLRCCA